jgi:hypothetical protein
MLLCYKLAATLTAALIVPAAPVMPLLLSILRECPASIRPEAFSGLNDIAGQPVAVR